MNTMNLLSHRFDVTALNRLKDETYIVESIPWNQISQHVVELVAEWEGDYDLLRQFEKQMDFKFNGWVSEVHYEMITKLYEQGRDILMILTKVERDSTPPIDLKENFDLLVKGLCALKISRRAFAPEEEESVICPPIAAALA